MFDISITTENEHDLNNNNNVIKKFENMISFK